MNHIAFHKTNPQLNCLLFFSAVLFSACSQTNKNADL